MHIASGASPELEAARAGQVEEDNKRLRAELGAALVERDEAIAQRDAFGQKAAALELKVVHLENELVLARMPRLPEGS